MIRLSGEEIPFEVGKDNMAYRDAYLTGAKAQLKKMVEWGNETCKDWTHSGDMPKRQCGFCWQSLLEEVK